MHRLFVCLTFAAAVAPVMRADLFYSFNGTASNLFGPPTPVSFTLATPQPITTDSTFFEGGSLTCPNCLDVTFDIDAVAHGFTPTPSSVILYDFTGGGGTSFFYFTPGAFATIGDYSVILLQGSNDATLSIKAASPVPEASSILLLGTVACCFFVALRRY